jgi:hypothetical protein
MRYCTNCGHQLGIGRYCTNCGARVPVPPAEAPATQEEFPTSVRPGEIPPLHPWGDDPLATAPPPPPLGPEPTTARYPLFADTVPAAAPLPVVVPTVPQTPPVRGRRSAFPWVAAALAVLAVVAVVGVLLVVLGGSGDDGKAADPRRAPDRRTQDSGAGSTSAGSPADVLTPSDVQVPGTAPASVDSGGAKVTFVADNMIDADPRTSWRMAGDASGSVITFTFDQPVTLTEVGLINGYAKTDPPHDWYAGNRRITDVTWTFDDGTEVAQTLGTTRSVQTTEVDSVETTTLALHIDGVTAPGTGPDSRNYTAISEVAFAGS